MVRQLRNGIGKTGLVLANGGVVTYQAAVCLSRSPRRDGLPYPTVNPLPEVTTDVQTPTVDAVAEGDATIEVRCPAGSYLESRQANQASFTDVYSRVQPGR